MTDDEILHLNGIDATTGFPLSVPLSSRELAALVRGVRPRSAGAGRLLRAWGALRGMISHALSAGPHLGLPDDDGIDPTDPRTVGWAVAIASDAPAEAVFAADRLFEHRVRHTGVPASLCKRLMYTKGCPIDIWLKIQRAHAADVEPTRLPYYVALVGDPESIPFEAQWQLGVHYAVGRLAFDDPAAYGRYVESLIAYETAASPPGSRDAVFWAPRNRDDPSTALSADCLVRPLFEGVAAEGDRTPSPAIAGLRGFRSHGLIGTQATSERLVEVLHGRGTVNRPSVLLTASHGLGWPINHADQPSRQGALVGQGWPGPGTAPRPVDYLASSNLADDARVHGLIAFLFACYGAGTPMFDQFPATAGGVTRPIAERPFISALPQRLLGHPEGGALAVVGHVERAWGYSIRPPRLGPSLLPFRNFLSRVMRGEPVGHATRDFGDRFTNASVRLLESPADSIPDNSDLAAKWIERNDARNYIILGDPAARLRIDALT